MRKMFVDIREFIEYVKDDMTDESLLDPSRFFSDDPEKGACMPGWAASRTISTADPNRAKMVPWDLIQASASQTTWSAKMASILTQTIAPDTVISFEINPGTLLDFLDTRAEGGPRLKCFEGSVTLVSP